MDRNEMLTLFIKLGRLAKKLIKEADDGKEKMEKNYFGDTSIKMDLTMENMVKEEIKDLNFRLITEEKPEQSRKNAKGVIILDPLDGSKNYERGFPAYSFAIAGANKNNPTIKDIEAALVIDLFSGDEYFAVNGKGAYKNSERIKLSQTTEEPYLIAGDFGGDVQSSSKVFPRLAEFAYMRMLGAATLDMANAASGVVDGYMDVRGTLLVTHTAGIALMKEAGLIVTDSEGKEILQPLSQDAEFTVIASRNKRLHEKLVGLCKS